MGKFLSSIFKRIKGGSQRSNASAPAAEYVSETDIRNAVFKVWCGDDVGGLKYINTLRYWQDVVVAICFAESNYNRFEYYFEETMGYPSLGLMQLSYEDCKAYGFALDKSKNEIFDVEKNIHLGMIILSRLVSKNKTIVFNDGNYWAVLQPKNKRHQVFLKKFYELRKGDV